MRTAPDHLGRLAFTAEEESFREALRNWLADNPPPPIDDVNEETTRSFMAWEGRVVAAGYGGLHWPAAYGGGDKPVGFQLVQIEEFARLRVPFHLTMVGWYMVGPLLMAVGNEDQRRRFLPGILRGEELWTQLFSEPDAGSDLASLRTLARADGDEFVVSGQKVWSSWAHLADRGLLLARTNPDARKHRGLSMLLVDMDTPGITVRPLGQMSGSADFNAVFFDEVRVGADRLVGPVNEGWRAALVVLGAERTGLALGSYAALALELSSLLALVGSVDDPMLRQAVARVFEAVVIQRLTSLRTASSMSSRPDQVLGAASIGKLQMTATTKELARLREALLGMAMAAWQQSEPGLEAQVRAALGSAASGIGGGTTEVQKNAIGERILGLAKEPPSVLEVASKRTYE